MYTYIHSYTRQPDKLGLLNTSTASLQRVKKDPHNECPGYDTKLHLMVRF